MTGDDTELREWAELGRQRGWIWCGNCQGQTCGACSFREFHDKCEDDCPECCNILNASGYTYAHMVSPAFHLGWQLNEPDRDPTDEDDEDDEAVS